MRDDHTRSLDNIERTSKCFEIINLIIKRCTIFLMTALLSATRLTVNISLALQYVCWMCIIRKAVCHLSCIMYVNLNILLAGHPFRGQVLTKHPTDRFRSLDTKDRWKGKGSLGENKYEVQIRIDCNRNIAFNLLSF